MSLLSWLFGATPPPWPQPVLRRCGACDSTFGMNDYHTCQPRPTEEAGYLEGWAYGYMANTSNSNGGKTRTAEGDWANSNTKKALEGTQ